MLISQTEPPELRLLGRPSRRTEYFGLDVLARAGSRWVGFQRKTMNDLIASLHDGRMSMERAQWRRLLDLDGVIVLIVEGRVSWSNEGVLMNNSGKPFTRSQYRRFCHSVMRQGVAVTPTDSLSDTIEVIRDLVDYHARPRTGSHRSGRPSPEGKWGRATSRDWSVHLLTSFPDIGPTTAEAILEAFGGPPLQWTVTREELLAVPGVGPKRVESLWKALHPLSVVQEKVVGT